MTTAVRTTILLVACICACGRTPTPSASATAPTELRHPGCFLVHDMTTGRTQAWESQSCDLRTSPASTFKIPHALIGLETGVIQSPDAVRPWDEKKHSQAPWGREDQTLTSAIQQSVVWYFQEIATEVGSLRMLAHLSQLDYGNGNIGDSLTTFWLDGSLAISGHEQLDFLRRFWSQSLPVSQFHVEAVQNILSQPVTALQGRVRDPERLSLAWATKAKLAFKTGSTAHDKGNVTWLVGRVQKGEADFVFVSRVLADGSPGATSPAVEAALQSLLDLGVL